MYKRCRLLPCMLAAIVALTLARLSTSAPPADDANDAIEGVRAAALDQPRIYLNLRRGAQGKVLESKGDQKLSAIEAFLDTGASGTVLSSTTAEQLGLSEEKTRDGKPIVFEDTGVAGSEKFTITEPLFVAMAPYPNGEDPADFDKPVGPMRMQVRPEGGILALVAPGLDIAGMPLMAGKVVVLDPTPLSKMDKIRTRVVLPGDRSIPKTSRHVPLTYVSFAKFTRITPANSARPSEFGNPMIGPDPLAMNDAKGDAKKDARKPVVIVANGHKTTGTFLLDTGAATSIISTKLAENLGIKLNDDGTPKGVRKEDQISMAIGGLGGAKQTTGLYFERLELPTREGKPIVYSKAPLMISDITVVDDKGNLFTLDGVLGMNYLVASAEITGGFLPDVGAIVDGPFKMIVIDHDRGEMGLEPR